MATRHQSRLAARIEFLVLRHQISANVISSALLLSPLALLPLVNEPILWPIFTSGSTALAFFIQWRIGARLFNGPPASAAFISVARDVLSHGCRQDFDSALAKEVGGSRTPLEKARVVELHQLVRRNWREKYYSDLTHQAETFHVQTGEIVG